MIKILLTLVVGLLGSLIARRMRLPAAFMTGSMIAVAVFSMVTGEMYMPRTMKIFAQIVSGAYIGQQVSKADLLNFPKLAKAIALLMLFFTINTFAMGWLFSKFFHLDQITALLSCLPGGIMDVSLISIDMGAQAEIVATMQLARLVGMLIILPYWIQFLLKRFQKNQDSETSEKPVENELQKKIPFGVQRQWANNLLILLVSSLGGLLGLFIGIPAGTLIFALLFSCALKITKNTAPLSNYIRFVAQIFAGSIIGCTFNQDSLAQLGKLIVPACLLLASYLVINVLFGFIVYKRGILDLKSALFASSPAGATDISLIAGELGGDMPKIAGIQICRTLYTVIVLPNLIRLFLSF
ncbi:MULTISPECIES: AbrB family transcriptional regulator [unclassified Enterococcus]|uniref:AbrB family transcriptional regulator n=1 Tax=unclassified Enterococcus TaxID=2608891 RepID=UPI0024738F6D|nr:MULTISPECIES: AbrB family transcriptional regulator [unclassified Enterococcus]